MSTGDSFMTIEGVAGEAEDSEFPGAIEVLGWDWGIEMSASTGRADVGTNARADVKVFTFAHRFDAASPVLMMHCINNKPLKMATLTMRQPRQRKGQKYLIIVFSSCGSPNSRWCVGRARPAARECVARFRRGERRLCPEARHGRDFTGKKPPSGVCTAE
jgi:hypothetical protein